MTHSGRITIYVWINKLYEKYTFLKGMVSYTRCPSHHKKSFIIQTKSEATSSKYQDSTNSEKQGAVGRV